MRAVLVYVPELKMRTLVANGLAEE